MPGPRLVLASRSPQRRAILERLGIPFDVVEPNVREATEGEPRQLVVANALSKARSVRARAEAGRPVLGVDTAVVLEGRPYGKPESERAAREVLEALAGRPHEVWSGIALLPAGRPGEREPAPRTGAAVTEVRFRPLEPALLDWYVASGEWRERAGGYAIQGRGAVLVEGIAGDPWNVVGLPVAELLQLEPGLILGGAGAPSASDI